MVVYMTSFLRSAHCKPILVAQQHQNNKKNHFTKLAYIFKFSKVRMTNDPPPPSFLVVLEQT